MSGPIPYPTEPGYYWVRAVVETAFDLPNTPFIVQVTANLTGPEVEFYRTGDEEPLDPSFLTGWIGPIAPPEMED